MSFGDIHVSWKNLKVMLLPIFHGCTRSETTFEKGICIFTQVRVNFCEEVLSNVQSFCWTFSVKVCVTVCLTSNVWWPIMACLTPNYRAHVLASHAVSHLPACPTSQTHKFPKRCTNLVLFNSSIWTQKITITITAYVFSSVNSASDRMRWYGSA